MAWAITAEVGRFSEAVDWFSKRSVISSAQARELDARTKSEAFWIGGGLHLHQVQRVFEKITKAIETGQSFQDFQKEVAGKLRDRAHTETVFRNATQRAYNAGRWAQMTHPDVLRFRPYGLVDAILDGRTTAYCISVDGVLLLLTDPWWLTHYFPAHHKCRTSVRNIRRAEAERRKQKLPPADAHPADGFGVAPGMGAPLKLVPKADPSLLLEFGKKVEPAVRPPAPADHHNASHWLPHYEPKYGEAAQSLAQGRASLERGLDMPIKQARDLLSKAALHSPGVKGLLDSMDGLPEGESLRNHAGELDPRRKGAAALAGHVEQLPARKDIRHRALSAKPEGQRVLGFYSEVSHPNLVHPVTADVRQIRGRAWASGGKKIRWSSAGNLSHEWAHCVEDLNPSLHRRAVAFLKARTVGEALRNLVGYKRKEVFKPDLFAAAYTGRWYETRGELYGTEIMSMSADVLFDGIRNGRTLGDLVSRDPEHFLFLLGQLAGL